MVIGLIDDFFRMINEIFGYLNDRSVDIPHSAISAKQLGQIMDLITSGKITGTQEKDPIDNFCVLLS